jgi:hypothetical protein
MKKIEKWNKKFEKSKENDDRKRAMAEAKMTFLLTQKKVMDELKALESGKEKDRENEKD